MLRFFVLLLLLANGVYFAWSQGLLRAYGFAPAAQAEPQRLTQQVRPEALRLLSPAETQRLQAQLAADQAPKECLMAGPLDDAQADRVRETLGSALPAEAWSLEPVVVPARWMLYMGKFTSAESLAKKRAELVAMNLAPQSVHAPELQPGLSLGGFDTQAQANVELARMQARGIRTARVVQERAESRGQMLRLPALTADMKARLADTKAALAGKSLHACH